EKVLVITALKKQLKGKAVLPKAVSLNPIDPALLHVDVVLLIPKLRKNRTAHIDYIKHTLEEAATLRELIITDLGTKLVAVTPKNQTKQSKDNTKKNRIRRTLKKAKETELEDHPRKVKSSLNKASVVDSRASSSVIKSVSNVNSNMKCASCNGCLFSDNHDKCVVEYINSVNASRKSKSAKKPVNRKVWKTIGKVFKTVGYQWKPTGRTFMLVGHVCPLHWSILGSPELRMFLTKWNPINLGDPVPMFLLLLLIAGTIKFGNDHVAKIMGYSDYHIRNVTISWVYYVEGQGHNFSVGRFCDSDLEVAFRQHTCFIRNLKGVDLLTDSQGNNLYTLSLQDMMASSPIWQFCDSDLEVAFRQHTCFIRNLEGASKTKSWLWHRRLSLLNFGAINHLARQGLVRGLQKLKFEKNHLCSACAMGKSTKKSHKPKSKDTNQEKLYLPRMDLCGPMRVESVNGKKYILIIVDDYSRFTWVKFLRSKDETPMFIIKFLKMIQVRLNVPVRRIRTDNGIEFVNQTLRDYYEEVGISHEKYVACSPQQNGVIERRNQTLIEAVRTMLIYAQAPLFLWAEVVATACFTQNRSIIRLRYGKTPYELMHGKQPDLSYFYMFGALCYPTNDGENVDNGTEFVNQTLRDYYEEVGISHETSVARSPQQNGVLERRNRTLIEAARTISGLGQKSSSSASYVPPSRNDWDLLFQPMFDELLNPPPSVVNQAAEVIAPITEVIPQVDADSTGSPSSTTVDQDAPSSSKYLTPTEIQSSVILQDVGNDNLDIEVAHMGNDPLLDVPIPEVTSEQSSSMASP
nr:retrovirus-related Pol polyprotein from transposon TNT 1-94 [Tanacetum cinerariifolium]